MIKFRIEIFVTKAGIQSLQIIAEDKYGSKRYAPLLRFLLSNLEAFEQQLEQEGIVDPYMAVMADQYFPVIYSRLSTSYLKCSTSLPLPIPFKPCCFPYLQIQIFIELVRS